MDNLDDSENNAKVSDSAYSNSCSNSQSRRSHSSKSTHSGSHSSRSSGYGGKPSTYSEQNEQPTEKRSKDKEVKQKKHIRWDKPCEVLKEENERPVEQTVMVEATKEEIENVELIPSPQIEKGLEIIEKAGVERSDSINEADSCHLTPYIGGGALSSVGDGFSCVISMQDGVVMYATSSLTTTLGYPKDMWIGRSFIDFVHSRDRNIFASHITSGLAVPKTVDGTIIKEPPVPNSVCTMVCRIRKYRSLSKGFGIKENNVAFMPFLLKLSFKNISDVDGKCTYLVIQATPFYSAYKTPNEVVQKPVPFIIRHAANGNVEYIDPVSVPYLGYLPQDLEGKDAMMLYHTEDLSYLRQVYETIVKEGGMPRCKPYRMVTQNWDYIKVETEWSSFINPWSKKLEFVIAKHHIIEGPTNPDVFQTVSNKRHYKCSEDEKNRAQCLRESIIRIMNEVLTKPAEAAKQQMSKRCQDLASFMESLLDEHPKPLEELHVEIQEQDHSYYERDSVMLGGISPHHDLDDSKSSVETTLSYNQINYNETLQRYFDSHQQHYPYEDYNTATRGNKMRLEDVNSLKERLSPGAHTYLASGDISSSDSGGDFVSGNSSATLVGETPPRLTESLINKHNVEMENELMKMHRQTKSCGKGERKRVTKENRQKKREHLARCNASYQPTLAINTDDVDSQPHGLKRASKQPEADVTSHKHHCPTPRQTKKKQLASVSAPTQPSTALTTTVDSPQWPQNMNNMNAFLVGYSPQMPIMSPVAAMPGMIPIYYAPAASTIPNATEKSEGNTSAHFPQPMQYMMYGQQVYGAPFMYSPMTPQIPYPHAAVQVGAMHANSLTYPLGLANGNYEEACKQIQISPKPLNMDKWNKSPLLSKDGTSGLKGFWRERERRIKNRLDQTTRTDQESGSSNYSSSFSLNRGGENCDQSEAGTMPMNLCFSGTGSTPNSLAAMNSPHRNKKSSDDRTDGESSYSSFYSSFFKTDSGSADDSGDGKKFPNNKGSYSYESPQEKKVERRRLDPPWSEKVCMSSELIYKYQILTKNMEEVLKEDMLKLQTLKQPVLVNEQLGQLYLDLQLQGVTSKLSLEEGVTSSSSSGEESCTVITKLRRKRNHHKFAMVYEEDAPLPPIPESDPSTPLEIASTSAI